MMTLLTVVGVLLTCTFVGISVYICVRYRTRICVCCVHGKTRASVSSDNFCRGDASMGVDHGGHGGQVRPNLE